MQQMQNIQTLLQNSNFWITVGISYELIIRFVPTVKNLSILELIKTGMLMAHNLVDIIVPNKRKDEE